MVYKILFNFVLNPCGDSGFFTVQAIITIIVNPDCDKVNYLYFIIVFPLEYGMCATLHEKYS